MHTWRGDAMLSVRRTASRAINIWNMGIKKAAQTLARNPPIVTVY
jgi:hypothetical protein